MRTIMQGKAYEKTLRFFLLNYKIAFYFIRLTCLGGNPSEKMMNAQLSILEWQIKSCPL